MLACQCHQRIDAYEGSKGNPWMSYINVKSRTQDPHESFDIPSPYKEDDTSPEEDLSMDPTDKIFGSGSWLSLTAPRSDFKQSATSDTPLNKAHSTRIASTHAKHAWF
jgi:hypothetical protein